MASNSQLGFKNLLCLYLSLLHCCYIVHSREADAETVTDPQEVEALKIIAKKMQNTKWDFTVDPCSGKGSWNADQGDETKNMVICTNTSQGMKFRHVTKIFLKSQNLSGVVPGELANLTYLDEIDIWGNYLNGSIPPELGSLTHLKFLGLGTNRLSGHIPPELGNLSSLIKLDLLANDLYGKLPRQLGDLSNLEQLNIAYNQFHGKIPKRFSYLNALTDFLAGSNNFSGKIPDFIGKWTNITTLRLEATSLEGPIPSTFSGLSKLTDMRITDLTGDGSKLSFMKDLTELHTIVLRNALIYGEIPKFIGRFKKLKTLDLSFNNLTGLIPDTLQSLKQEQMVYLYLGNNSLTGTPPTWLSDYLHVDLSYNNFSGEFPSWMTDNIQVNLVGNSFNNNLVNRSGQAYFQRGFTCHKGPPQNTDLAINCGGEIQNNFEQDDNALGPSKFFLSPKENWAVSSTGHFMDAENHQWIVHANYSQFAKGISTELYGAARCASNSLRYYGLCLKNGKYNVQLRFAEIVISNGKSFASLGRRIFDVYIQGTRRLQNFNIKHDAGGANKVLARNFTVNVTENYLEIHFFWAGKGTYEVPVKGTYGPLVSAIIISPDSNINTSNGRNSSNKPMIIGIVSGVVIFLGLAVCLSFIFIKKKNGTESRFVAAHDDRELTNMNTISNTFSLDVIKIATSDFNSNNKIGEGGFGAVFKGILPDGSMVAVKQMFPKSRQGSREFLNELGTISAVQHPNLVKLYGCCIEGKQLLLIYEYMENNSLARGLFGPQEFRISLNWPQRYNICLGVARGLTYLHEESRLRIVHRDIKATNILLDQHLNPKISDFGFAKLFDLEKTHVSTRVAGTIGYMAPEYALKGHLTEKADVYSFGVVVLEVVSGRTHTEKTLQGEMVYLLEWTCYLHEENRLLDLVDVNLKNSSYSEEEVLRMINVGLLCTHATPMLRPSMSTVVGMLEGKIEALVSHSRPSYLGNWQPNIHTEEKSSSLSKSLSLEGPSGASSSS